MDDHDGADAIERTWRDGLKPDPLLTVSEWADRYRVLSQRASSEPGRWRTDRDPESCGYGQLEEPVSYDLGSILGVGATGSNPESKDERHD